MAEVVLDHVYKVYPGEVTAVEDVSVTIHDREFVVLVGPSGCGKSTTLRMVAGLEEISRGTISIDGTVVNNVAPKDYALYPHMSVRENMAFGLKLRKFPKKEIDTRVEEAAAILELSKLLDRKPKALSGGQRQRVALGRAIVRKPKGFLFDEPLSNLDAKLRNQMRTEILRIYKHLEATVVYVTHDQVEAMTMGTRIVVMKDGIVQQVASPIDLYNNPANLFVAGFIGSPTMNFLRGSVEHAMFQGDGVKVAVSGLQNAGGEKREVILGIRPEDLELEGSGENGRLEGRVEITEPLGPETYLHVSVGGQNVIARVDPNARVKVGETATLYFHPDRGHLFDPASEVVLR